MTEDSSYPFHSFSFTLVEGKRPRAALRLSRTETGMYSLHVEKGSASAPTSQFTREVPVETAERVRDVLQGIGAYGWDEKYGDESAPGTRRWTMNVVFREDVFTLASRGGSDTPAGFEQLLEELYRLDFPRSGATGGASAGLGGGAGAGLGGGAGGVGFGAGAGLGGGAGGVGFGAGAGLGGGMNPFNGSHDLENLGSSLSDVLGRGTRSGIGGGADKGAGAGPGNGANSASGGFPLGGLAGMDMGSAIQSLGRMGGNIGGLSAGDLGAYNAVGGLENALGRATGIDFSQIAKAFEQASGEMGGHGAFGDMGKLMEEARRNPESFQRGMRDEFRRLPPDEQNRLLDALASTGIAPRSWWEGFLRG